MACHRCRQLAVVVDTSFAGCTSGIAAAVVKAGLQVRRVDPCRPPAILASRQMKHPGRQAGPWRHSLSVAAAGQ